MRKAPLAVLALTLAGCGMEPEPTVQREERWVGYGTSHSVMLADSGGSKHYEFIFEYAEGGPYADDEFVALLTVDSGKTYRGDGFRAASESAERILVDVDTTSFSGPVEDDTLWNAYMWLGDSIADSIVFVLNGIDGRRPSEATDSVSGIGSQSVEFTLDKYGPHDCYANLTVTDYDFVNIDFRDARNAEHEWYSELLDSGSYSASWVATVGFDPNVEKGEGRLIVDADSSTEWAVWCRKQAE